MSNAKKKRRWENESTIPKVFRRSKRVKRLKIGRRTRTDGEKINMYFKYVEI